MILHHAFDRVTCSQQHVCGRFTWILCDALPAQYVLRNSHQLHIGHTNNNVLTLREDIASRLSVRHQKADYVVRAIYIYIYTRWHRFDRSSCSAKTYCHTPTVISFGQHLLQHTPTAISFGQYFAVYWEMRPRCYVYTYTSISIYILQYTAASAAQRCSTRALFL